MRYAFDWDPAKAAGNLAKHGVAFDDVMGVFLGPRCGGRGWTNTTARRRSAG